MIVKIQNNFGGFFIFDNVEDLMYKRYRLKWKKLTERQSTQEQLASPDSISRTVFKGGSCNYTDISFCSGRKWYRFAVDRVVYLLSNEGKTVDTIIV